MIATPDTGVDSIAVNYALLDPIMTVARPIAALITSVVTGICINAIDSDTSPPAQETACPAVAPACGCSGGCPSAPVERGLGFATGVGAGSSVENTSAMPPAGAAGVLARLRKGLG